MPVKKVGNKYEVKGIEYDTENEANAAYMAYLDAALGVKKTRDAEVRKTTGDSKKHLPAGSSE